jgi:hypothetical protein
VFRKYQTKLTVPQGFSWEKLPPQWVMRGENGDICSLYYRASQLFKNYNNILPQIPTNYK